MNERIAIIGVGLIGGSFALALRAAGHAGEIVGVDREPRHLAEALGRGVVDRIETDAVAGVRDADLVLAAVPMGQMRAVFEAIAPGLSPAAVVTDTGSVKGSVVADARAALGPDARFVPGHPIAGTERAGVGSAFAELFNDRRVILTPLAATAEADVEFVAGLWRRTGALVEMLAVEDHDRLLAVTSHLPHMLAFGLVDALARDDEAERLFRYAAGGFRDFTRIASSDPLMWRDICIANREALLSALDAYREDLEALTREVRDADADGLLARFDRAKNARDRYCP